MKDQLRVKHGAMLALAALALVAVPRPAAAGNWNVKSVSELVAAINAANNAGGANTISLACGKTFTLTAVNNITDGPTGLPVIAANNTLTIRGNGATIARSKAAGIPAFRLFDVASGAALTLQNVTLANGLVIGDTGMDASGGAILNAAGASLTVKCSVLCGNQVVGGDGAGGLGGFGFGGAVCSDGTANFEGVVFRGNQATGGATANSPDLSGWGGAAFGGAIISQNQGNLAVRYCWFTGNKVIGGLRHYPSAPMIDGISDGGAIHNWGAACITDTTFTENQAIGGPADTGEDGGYACDGAVSSGSPLAVSPVCIIQRCTFSRNQAIGADAGPNNFGGSAVGGALSNGYSQDASDMSISDCWFTGNQALGGSGGVGGDGNAGALNVESPLSLTVALTTITNCTFTHNKAVGGRAGGGAYGGAIRNGDWNLDDGSGATLVISACMFDGNLALGAPGGSGGILRDGTQATSQGEGGGVDTDGKTTILGSVFKGNQAIGGALGSGVVANYYTACWGGGLACWSLEGLGLGGTVEIRDSSFVGNRVSAGDASLGGTPSIGLGGGIGIYEGWPASIVNCYFMDNTAAGGAGSNGTPGAAGVGGGLAVGYSAVTVTGTTIRHNQANGGTGGGQGLGGGYAVGIGALFGFPDTSSVTLNGGSVVKDNKPDNAFHF